MVSAKGEAMALPPEKGFLSGFYKKPPAAAETGLQVTFTLAAPFVTLAALDIAGLIRLLLAGFSMGGFFLPVTGECQCLQNTEDMILLFFRKHREILDKLAHIFIIDHVLAPDM